VAYAAHADVSAEFKNTTFGSDTTPTATVVTEWIVQEENLIDAWVGKRYETPVSGATAALSILKRLSVQMVAHRIREYLGLKNQDEKLTQFQNPSNKYAAALKQLEQIAKGDMPLPGATLLSTNAGVESFNVDEEEEHQFEKGEDQW
jgi:phage gp36-like protein